MVVDFALETSEIDADGNSDLCGVCTRVLDVDGLGLRIVLITGFVFESGAVIDLIFDRFADFGFADEGFFRFSIVVVFVFDKAITFETLAVAVSAFGTSNDFSFVIFDGFGSVEVDGIAKVFIVFDDVGTGVCNDG